MLAEGFLRWLLVYLCTEAIPHHPGPVSFPALDAEELRRVTDALSSALELVRAAPAEAEEGVPQPVVGYTVRCPDCRHSPVRWCGIAFSRGGAAALLQEHRAHLHLG